MKKFSLIMLSAMAVLMLASCTSYRHVMREPNAYVEFRADDFEISEAFTGEATVTRVLALDWEHTFGSKKNGLIGTGNELPIIGTFVSNTGAAYALYDLLKKHPGYDVVLYPQVEAQRTAPIFGTNIFSVTTYKVTARLGRLKSR